VPDDLIKKFYKNLKEWDEGVTPDTFYTKEILVTTLYRTEKEEANYSVDTGP
jgi:hypothetical protein